MTESYVIETHGLTKRFGGLTAVSAIFNLIAIVSTIGAPDVPGKTGAILMQLLAFALLQTRNRNARPARDDRGDVLLCHFFA